MAAGPGKYDELCTYVREQSQAGFAVVIVVDGTRGSGFSVQGLQGYEGNVAQLPEILEHIAAQIRADPPKS